MSGFTIFTLLFKMVSSLFKTVTFNPFAFWAI